MTDTELQAVLRASIHRIISKVRSPIAARESPYLELRRTGDGRWQGEFKSIRELDFWWDEGIDWPIEAAELERFLIDKYPDHLGLVGTGFGGQTQFTSVSCLSVSVAALIAPTLSVDVDQSEMNALLRDVDQFFRRPSIRLHFLAPLLNFRRDAEGEIEIREGLRIRRISDREATTLFGGSLYMPKSRSHEIHEWAIVGELDAPKLLRDNSLADDTSLLNLKAELDSIVLGLRAFKAGSIGYGGIYFTRVGYVPLSSGMTALFADEYVPAGNYGLSAAEDDALVRHLTYIRRPLHPSISVAASRLAMCSIRLDPRDRLIDAVIGSEAILLASLSDRGELRFRFALNYALLRPVARRQTAFSTAQTLYDLRSKIAHGLPAPSTVKLKDEVLSFSDIADTATEMLRELVKQFLPDSPELPAATREYWQAKYLN